MWDETDEYIHSKTGNVYSVIAEATPIEVPPEDYIILIKAFCCEDKRFSTEVYFTENQCYYIPVDGLHEKTLPKVVYERDSKVWLRSTYDFHKVVGINGIKKPRFVKI